jgi:glycosyltransferase involved in cell wall biosynthesis
MTENFTWAVINQSQNQVFQDMLESLAEGLGPCMVYTGCPYPAASSAMCVERGPRYGRKNGAHRVATWAHFTACAAARIARIRHRPFLLLVTNPPLLPYVGWLAHKLKGLRYGVLVWDIYPDHVVAAGMLGDHHPLVRGWRDLNRRALLGAEQVITIGDVMAKALEGQLNGAVLRRPIKVIPNWADPEVIRPIPKQLNPLAKSLDQLNRVTVMYSGNMGATHQLDAVMGAAERLASKGRISFVFMGDGIGQRHLQAEKERRNLLNLTMLPTQPWDVFAKAIAVADINIVSQKAGSEHLSLPSKTYSALAAGSAILALTSPESDLGQLVTEQKIGRVASPDDEAAIADAIATMTSDPVELARMQHNARRLVEERFNPTMVKQMWHDTLAPLVLR